ncbi:hypothetical protein HELRODRAFT_143205, partial [Helobdella robusta]|uniref:Cytochrome P450 n=1 Tax=Helobdella robusta TaxID=6412 RepID=T1EJ94_HELRO
FDPCRCIQFATTNILNSLIFGCRYTYKSRRLQDLVNIINMNLSSRNIFNLECNFKNNASTKNSSEGCKNLKFHRMFIKHMLGLIDNEIESHKQKHGFTQCRDIIDVYLKCSSNGTNNLSRMNLDLTILEFFTYGVHQMSSYLLWALHSMKEYPDVQNRCHDEIDQKIGPFRPINIDDMKDLPYVNATLREVSRRFTVVPLSQPSVLKDDLKLGPYFLTKDSLVICNYYAVHMNKNVWKEPLTFCPERFMN